MLFYDFTTLDDFIKNNLIFNIKQEIIKLRKIIKLYNNKKDFISLELEEQNNSINDIIIFANKLSNDLNMIISLYDKGLDNNYNEIKANLVEYNKKENELFQKIIDFENIYTNTKCQSNDINSNSFYKKYINVDEDFTNNRIDIETSPQDNNMLIISEKDQKAYLPFYYSEIKKIFKDSNNEYLTLQDVVNKLYVLPLDKFKNSSFSRFRESFNLILKKEKGSILKALDLGLELMFKYELNPIIIAACRNLKELDIYLDCLEENEAFEFDCFKIKFEVTPQ